MLYKKYYEENKNNILLLSKHNITIMNGTNTYVLHFLKQKTAVICVRTEKKFSRNSKIHQQLINSTTAR